MDMGVMEVVLVPNGPMKEFTANHFSRRLASGRGERYRTSVEVSLDDPLKQPVLLENTFCTNACIYLDLTSTFSQLGKA